MLFSYRTKSHESTRESPFYLLYGCDARLPTATVDMPPSPYTVDLDDYKVELTRGLASAWKVARLERSARHSFDRKEARQEGHIQKLPGRRQSNGLYASRNHW